MMCNNFLSQLSVSRRGTPTQQGGGVRTRRRAEVGLKLNNNTTCFTLLVLLRYYINVTVVDHF